MTMRIRLRGTPDKIQAFAAAFRETFDVVDESEDYRDRTPSKLVRRYLEIELRAEAGPAPSPVAQAEDAKRRRDLGGEIGILMNADADLNAQTWLPLRAGDVVLMAFADEPDLSETYLAVPDDSTEGAALLQISSQYPIHDGAPPIPFYDLWFEAGRNSLTVIRAGAVIFGAPRTVVS